MEKVSKKISDARRIFNFISEDINEILEMAEVSVPIIENVVDKVKLRASQIEGIFGLKEEKR